MGSTTEYMRQWTEKNRERRRQLNAETRRRIYEWYNEYKATLRCERCGFSHPAALDFHHRVPADKQFEIPRMVANGYSKEKILAEMAKCEVLCANCHRIHHNMPR